jgi:hypothetical protein
MFQKSEFLKFEQVSFAIDAKPKRIEGKEAKTQNRPLVE